MEKRTQGRRDPEDKKYLFEMFSEINQNLLILVPFILYIAWFGYIYGILGHVCPVAFIGMWHATLLSFQLKQSHRVRIFDVIFTLVLTAAIFSVCFFILQPIEEPLSRNVVLGPILGFMLTPVILGLYLSVFSRASNREAIPIIAKLCSVLEFLGNLAAILVPLWFFFDLNNREQMYIQDSMDWYDTVFSGYDVYHLFLFLAIAAFIFAIIYFIGLFKQIMGKPPAIVLFYQILGQSFFGMLLIGTIITQTYLGLPIQDEK